MARPGRFYTSNAGPAGPSRKSTMFGIIRARPQLPASSRETAVRRNRMDRADAYDNAARLRRDHRRGRYAGTEDDMLALIRKAEALQAAIGAQGRLIARGDDLAIRRATEVLELQRVA
jgi:hypothetical protein